MSESKIPLVQSKLNYFGLPSTLSFDTAWDELQNILTEYSSTDNNRKLDTFINVLRTSNKAWMVRLAERLNNESDEVKAALPTIKFV